MGWTNSIAGLGSTFVVGALVVGCVSRETPRTRVARDLACTADRTTVNRLAPGRWQVTGCGKTAVYVCTEPVRDCWRQGEIYPEGTVFQPTEVPAPSPTAAPNPPPSQP